jgi:hypothetical protein
MGRNNKNQTSKTCRIHIPCEHRRKTFTFSRLLIQEKISKLEDIGLDSKDGYRLMI